MKPTDFDSLILYLKKNPVVLYQGTGPTGELVEERRTFLEYSGGGLWFLRPDGQTKRFCPLACGKVGAATGVRYKEDGFEVTKFGLTIRFGYLEGQ